MFGGAIFGAEFFGQGSALGMQPEGPSLDYCVVSALVRLEPSVTATRNDPTLTAFVLTPPLVVTVRAASVTVTKLILPDP